MSFWLVSRRVTTSSRLQPQQQRSVRTVRTTSWDTRSRTPKNFLRVPGDVVTRFLEQKINPRHTQLLFSLEVDPTRRNKRPIYHHHGTCKVKSEATVVRSHKKTTTAATSRSTINRINLTFTVQPVHQEVRPKHNIK